MVRLDVQDVSFGYRPGTDVLAGACLGWEGPGVLCLLGANGAGKSTLLRVCTGELRPRAGRVCLDGRPVTAYDARALAQVLAYIPQHHTPAFDFTVLDVATMGRAAHLGLLSAPGRTERALAHRQLGRLGIADLADRPYTAVSGGQRQLVLIAAALAQEPHLLLLDEPAAPLDLGNQQRFLSLVRELARTGIGVVMTTHSPDHALALGGTTALLSGGRVLDVGPPENVVTTASLTDLYGTPIDVVTVGGRRVCVPGELR